MEEEGCERKKKGLINISFVGREESGTHGERRKMKQEVGGRRSGLDSGPASNWQASPTPGPAPSSSSSQRDGQGAESAGRHATTWR